MQNGIKFFRYLTDLDGEFSFRRYIHEQRQGVQPNLFILNVDQYAELFKPLMTLAINIMVRETLSLPDDLNRRIWFIIDELGTLSRMDSIIRLETVGRSKGACIICANQDLGRIEEVYGQANKQSFFNNFNTTLTFRSANRKRRTFFASIGERQVIKVSRSKQMSPSTWATESLKVNKRKPSAFLCQSNFRRCPI